ncbi:Atxe2 family lasso peptide isopeptidase [Novosphingobium terrae]|uniref:Atxe2 family lasso peptide isopeptidase n=1 Tax=Novosphingobium terrae TaxID=2726189 RepID=UPI0019810A15|nr:Atxe2 family lasso peptide isopeptidase [Novosphingobium terrae]
MVSFINRRTRLAALRTTLPLMCLMAGAHTAHAACADLLPVESHQEQPSRFVTSDDLLRLREIGSSEYSYKNPGPLAVSPDGKHIAFPLVRLDPATNTACRAMVVINREGAPDPRILDQGGEQILIEVGLRGATLTLGQAASVSPVWSPDGRWVAYRRRDHGITQVWRARSDGGGAMVVTRSPVDVDAFTWSEDGHDIVYTSRPSKLEAVKAIDKEGESGWHFDARIAPNFGARPLTPSPLPDEAYRIDPVTGTIVAASAPEKAKVTRLLGGLPAIPLAAGLKVWTEHTTDNPDSPLRLLVSVGGKTVTCGSADCNGALADLWWDRDGKSLLILKREGWQTGETGLFRWRVGARAPQRILHSADQFHACVPAEESLVCAVENATMPKRIISIDLHSGAQRLIFDPNPEFQTIRLGHVERLKWVNDVGLSAYGDLVLPPDYKPGTRLPMVITQYRSRGFLRGGTGDEYPIHAFAARGFAVLSLEAPDDFAAHSAGIHDWHELYAAGIKNWSERKSQLSSIITGVKMVIDRGIADPERIGITGLSDGATETRFALVNSRLFAAAAISSCCTDTRAMMNAGGIGFADEMHRLGYPRSIEPIDFWAPISMTLAARRMDRPLLMQLADSEFNISLETFTALHEAGQPVDMYVYPGESHIKWQPLHKQAVYNRNLDWFSFWLQGKTDPDPAKAEQYKRWQDMRRKLEEKAAASKP